MELVKLFLLSILFISTTIVAAQTESDSSLINLPSINELVEAAIEHSPFIQSQHTQMEIDEKEISLQKRKWLDYLFIEGTANYGIYDQVILQDNTSPDGSYNYGFLNRGESTRYYGGVGIKLPFSSLTSRTKEVEKLELVKKKSLFTMQDAENQLRTVIIEAYYNLKYLDESMRTYYDIYQTLNVAYVKAEKDLLNGRTDINKFALLASTVGKAKDDYNKAKHNFYAHYHQLMELTGLEF
nr:TolC family protein [uncultured Carboxylicivirga sp.]